jgi:hypothetical protein
MLGAICEKETPERQVPAPAWSTPALCGGCRGKGWRCSPAVRREECGILAGWAASRGAAGSSGSAMSRGRREGSPARGRLSGGGEAVSVEFEQVVRGREQSPLGPDGRAAAAQEAVGGAVGLDLPEDRLDDRLTLAVERCTVLGREDAAHEVIEPATTTRPRLFCDGPRLGRRAVAGLGRRGPRSRCSSSSPRRPARSRGRRRRRRRAVLPRRR